MAVELDRQAQLATLRAAGVRRCELYPNGALRRVEFFPPVPGAEDEPATRDAPTSHGLDESTLYGSAGGG